ncbi:hypothetical protein [Herbaspirillum sp. B65]|jgi:hypothetical protein|uniref:hypothetical protein n=1 Tax=Herbaspirillum sp. B65 TaxID=137708 RepID=UPI0011D1DA74|nr:hypothetical protein [Herbaspirillum sp. B65]
MQSKEEAQHDEAQKLFEKLLKRSRHFADVTNTRRVASGEVIAALVGTFVSHDKDLAPVMVMTLQKLQIPTGRPSIDSERQILTRLALQALAPARA